jgi:hypothetical protein
MFFKIRKFFCYMGWHGKLEPITFEGEYDLYKCTCCGEEGWKDSQGNLF